MPVKENSDFKELLYDYESVFVLLLRGLHRQIENFVLLNSLRQVVEIDFKNQPF